MLPAGIVAVSWDAETKIVVRVTALRLTTDAATKFVPVTEITVSGAPTATIEGDTELNVGIGSLTARSTELDAPPPGDGFVTTTGKLPPTARSA